MQEQEFDFNTELTPGSIKGAMKGVQSADLWMVPRDKINRIPNFNVREHNEEYDAAVQRYYDSIKANGYKKELPMAGYVAKENGEDKLYLTNGYTRLDAIDRLITDGVEIARIPVVVSQTGVSIEDLIVGLVQTNSGRPLTPYETAIVCKRLVGYNMTPAEIAGRLSFTEQYVNNLLKLVAAPEAVRKLVASGTVSATQAIETLQQHGNKATTVLEKAAATALKDGKKKITKKNLDPHAVLDKGIKKHSGEMYDVLIEIEKSGFTVNAKTKTEIKRILDALDGPLLRTQEADKQ